MKNNPTCGQRGETPAYKHNCLMYQQRRLLVFAVEFSQGLHWKPRTEDNGALLTVIAGFLLQGGHRTIFMSQEKLLQPSHFVSQQGDFALWGQEREQNTGGARQTVMSDIT